MMRLSVSILVACFAADAPALTVQPGAGVTLHGDVRSDDGAPIDRCTISFVDLSDRRRHFRTEVVGGQGYAIDRLHSGTWLVRAEPPGYVPMLRHEIRVTDDARQRIDLVFERPHVVTVKMQTPDGTPLRQAMRDANRGEPFFVDVVAVATRRPPDGDLPMTDQRTHDVYGLGQWRSRNEVRGRRLPTDAIGQLELWGQPPAHVSAVYHHAVLATAALPVDADEITLTVSLDALRARTSTLALRVVDADSGDPVPAYVVFSTGGAGGPGQQTDSKGRVRFAHRPIGIVDCTISALGYERFHQLLRIEPGEHDLGDVRFWRSRTLRGVTVGTDGEPIAATIRWQHLGRRLFPQEPRQVIGPTAEIDGAFELSLGAGRHLLLAHAPGKGVASVEVDTEQLGDDPIRVVLQPEHPVDILSNDVERTKAYFLTIFDGERLPVWAQSIRGFDRIAGLAAGDYTYEIHQGDQLVRKGQVSVHPDERPSITVP